ncbi:unnamed protein product [Lactuca saligna]|uniref:Uncharacterized protein n=1 Tax=Lactuca saligna TaxID=75948 RepID=A0AA36A282_LACSI|nr:unnamed protein product [Lactuca saligna]
MCCLVQIQFQDQNSSSTKSTCQSYPEVASAGENYHLAFNRGNHLGYQSYWDATYADELTNFREHGDLGEVWFGADVMEMVASWTKGLCVNISQRHLQIQHKNDDSESVNQEDKELAGWRVLDVGTGNGLLFQELAKQGS